MNLNDYLQKILVVDILCIQETKGSRNTLEKYTNMKDFKVFFSYNKIRNGHSGVCIIVSKKLYVRKVFVKIDSMPEESAEGRLILMDCGSFKLLNAYFPFYDYENPNEKKYEKMKQFYSRFYKYASSIEHNLIICGDINATYLLKDHYQYQQEYMRIQNNSNQLEFGVDGKLEKSHRSLTSLAFYYKDIYYLENDFFAVYQREWMRDFVNTTHFVDVTNHFHPDQVKYTCWNTMLNLRPSNLGTRIDYIFVSKDLLQNVQKIEIDNDVYGSDHCPVIMDIDLIVLNEPDNIVSKKEGLHAFLQLSKQNK